MCPEIQCQNLYLFVFFALDECKNKAECVYCIQLLAAASLLSSELYKALKDTDLLFMSSDTAKQFLNSISMLYELILCKDFKYL